MTYSKHIAQCNQYSQSGPYELARTVAFVLATIQQRLETVPRILSDFESHGAESRHAFGSKAAGLRYIRNNQAELYAHAMLRKDQPHKLLRAFLQVPGLGMVKAGFACQLFAGTVGCIDSHNIKLYGVPLSALRYTSKLLPDTQRKKQRQYVELCDGLGGSEFLWRNWCEHVARLRPDNWDDGLAVSRFHVDTLGGFSYG